jgi:hypothetical protein
VSVLNRVKRLPAPVAGGAAALNNNQKNNYKLI